MKEQQKQAAEMLRRIAAMRPVSVLRVPTSDSIVAPLPEKPDGRLVIFTPADKEWLRSYAGITL